MVGTAEWTTQRERGSAWVIRMVVWLALRLGRTAMRAALYPICLYFMLVPSHWQAASRVYLPRALGRKARFADGWRHCHSFASCLLDRVYLLHGQSQLFTVSVQGAAIVDALQAEGDGCLLFGAHFGSFEAARAAGRGSGHQAISLVMYEENARKTGAVLAAINPALAVDIISLGRPGAMLAVRDRLEEGHLVGLLADRGLSDDGGVRLPFLGAPAAFPEGPFRMAALLRRPIVLMFGIYRGGARYDIVFETLENSQDVPAAMRDYVSRLERHCRDAPYNWFNFYDFWR